MCDKEGAEVACKEGGNFKKLKVPIYKWDGKMSRDRDVFSPARMDGSSFVGSC